MPYKITFFDTIKKKEVTKKVKTKAEIALVGQYFKHNNVNHRAEEYTKNEEGRYGWKEFEASNFCRVCGRALTDPTSVSRGIGPICYGKYNVNGMAQKVDTETQILDASIAKRFLEFMHQVNCRTCGGTLGSIVYYYEHSEGVYIEELDKKVWVWVECNKCQHQWSIYKLHKQIDLNKNKKTNGTKHEYEQKKLTLY